MRICHSNRGALRARQCESQDQVIQRVGAVTLPPPQPPLDDASKRHKLQMYEQQVEWKWERQNRGLACFRIMVCGELASTEV